jgi:hypothetical protein
MEGFSSSIASSGGGGNAAPYDPSQYLGGGQSDGNAQSAGQSAAPGPSADFVQSLSKQGMQVEQLIDTLSGQFPEAAEDFRTAKQALKKGMAKILTTNSQASGGPTAPRSV